MVLYMNGVTFQFQLPNSIHSISKFDVLIHRFSMSKLAVLSDYIPFSSVELINDCLLRAVAAC